MSVPRNGDHWGLFGGLFDPVHNGHISLASDILRAERLDRILFVPSFNPPHRTESVHASFDDRITMLEIALPKESCFRISKIESENEEPGYTLHTIRTLKEHHPGVTFSLIVGADNLNSFREWYRWEELLQETTLLVGKRPGSEILDMSGIPRDRVRIVETELIDISSTKVRAALRTGIDHDTLATMVPPDVAEYITTNRLYQ